jgi:hypothetical protein
MQRRAGDLFAKAAGNYSQAAQNWVRVVKAYAALKDELRERDARQMHELALREYRTACVAAAEAYETAGVSYGPQGAKYPDQAAAMIEKAAAWRERRMSGPASLPEKL